MRSLKRSARTALAEPIGRPRREQDLPWDRRSIAARHRHRRRETFRIDFHHAFVCGKTVAGSSTRGAGISVTVRIPNVCGWCVAGWRQSGSSCVASSPKFESKERLPPGKLVSAACVRNRIRCRCRNRLYQLYCRIHLSRGHAAEKIRVRFATASAVTNRHVRPAVARLGIVDRTVARRCSVCVTVSESPCGARHSSDGTSVRWKHRSGRRRGVPRRSIALQQRSAIA